MTTTTEPPATRPGTCTARPCRNGDHYGQCADVTAPYFECGRMQNPEPDPTLLPVVDFTDGHGDYARERADTLD